MSYSHYLKGVIYGIKVRLQLIRVARDSLLDHLGIHLLSRLHHLAHESVLFGLVLLVIPLLVVLFNQALLVKDECDLAVDGLCGALLLQRNGRLENVVLCEVDLKALWC